MPDRAAPAPGRYAVRVWTVGTFGLVELFDPATGATVAVSRRMDSATLARFRSGAAAAAAETARNEAQPAVMADYLSE